jgi:hypothetical protein
MTATWDYVAMWFGCAQTSMIDWSFPHGTLVSAQSYEDAMDALHRYKLSRNNARAHQTEQGRWTVQFDNSIYIMVEAHDQAEAIRRASWQFYMDKREARKGNGPYGSA